MRLDLKLIRTDGGTQARAKLNQQIIEEYAQQMKADLFNLSVSSTERLDAIGIAYAAFCGVLIQELI